jgi:hypothetical protein
MRLMTSTNELLYGSICDMLKALIIAFPPNTPIPHIYNMAITLIETNMAHKINVTILKFWYFITQEYTPA